ncbi:proteoglycan Cow-like [Oppia nitens]|uniref:proteoglycan Cow-like n=1 Tax=Oppia nitens TaxID=1686743 RepID=UPI0023DC1A86|nr:proteoglycan Cow-like [Oppia nitens]
MYPMTASKCLSLVLLVTLFVCFVDSKQSVNEIHSSQDIHFDDDDDDDINDDKDFDFDDKKSISKQTLNRDLKQMYNWWTVEDICKDVKCKPWQYCVIKGKGVAVCVTKKDAKNGKKVEKDPFVEKLAKSKQTIDSSIDDEDDDEEDDYEEDIEDKSNYSKLSDDTNPLKQCTPCPVVRPEFICGSDNATYSSKCRLDFHNCVHRTRITLQCNGFCPCNKKSFSKKYKNDNKKWLETTRKTGKDFDNNNLKNTKLREIKKSNNNKEKDFNQNDWQKQKKPKLYYKQQNKFKKSDDKDSRNSVLPNKHWDKASTIIEHKKCSADELKSMGSRLLDWFSVVIAEQKKDHSAMSRKHSAFKIPDCQPQVSYMFHHFDTNGDLKLSLKELYYLEHDQNEHCLQPYLTQCDEDNDQFLSAYEWCTCFDRKSQPCLHALKHMKKGLLGAYTPQCDIQGFYKPMQCHSSSGMCWCVDKNGVEFTNTRRRGLPDCKGLLNRARHRTIDALESREDIDVDDDGDDDDDNGGSGDDRISL